MSLYTCRRTDGGFRVVKFDEDVNVLAIYDLELTRSWMNCSCPASGKWTCRHREMIALFQSAGAVDRGQFLDYDSNRWRRPIKGRTRA